MPDDWLQIRLSAFIYLNILKSLQQGWQAGEGKLSPCVLMTSHVMKCVAHHLHQFDQYPEIVFVGFLERDTDDGDAGTAVSMSFNPDKAPDIEEQIRHMVIDMGCSNNIHVFYIGYLIGEFGEFEQSQVSGDDGSVLWSPGRDDSGEAS